MRPHHSAALATALRRLLVCDVTVAHHLRTAWSLTTAGASESTGPRPGLDRWAALIAQSDLEDGPGLALLSHAQTLAPALPAILLLVPDHDAEVRARATTPPQSSQGRSDAFFSHEVAFTNPIDTAHALVRAMGEALEAQEPSGIGPRPGADLEPLAGEPGAGAFTGANTPSARTLRPRGAPFRWR